MIHRRDTPNNSSQSYAVLISNTDFRTHKNPGQSKTRSNQDSSISDIVLQPNGIIVPYGTI